MLMEKGEIIPDIDDSEKQSNLDFIRLLPTAAGFLLIISGLLAIFFSLTILMIDTSTLEQLINTTQLQQYAEYITTQQLKNIYNICGSIGFAIAIFSIFGGILAIRKKMFLVVLIAGFLGLFTLLYVLPGIITIIAIILLIVSRKEFQ